MAFADPQRNIDQFELLPGMKVADFGAGAGYLAVAAAEAVGETGVVYVIDIQADLLTKAKHLAEEHHEKVLVFLRGDLETPRGSTLDDASVDAVICSNILFQVEHKSTLVSEIKRVLRPKGRVLVVDWRDSFGGIGPQPEHVLSEESTKALFGAAGFVFVKEIDTGTYHYGFIYRTQV